MSKKNELNDLVKGKGIARFAPTPPKQKVRIERDKKVGRLSKKKQESDAGESDQMESQVPQEEADSLEVSPAKQQYSSMTKQGPAPTIAEACPDGEDLRLIDELSLGAEVFAVVWKSKIYDMTGAERDVFRELEQIVCSFFVAVPQILVDFKAEVQFQQTVFELASGKPALLFERLYSGRLRQAHSVVEFELTASISGIFRPRAILTLNDTGLFSVAEGPNFRIMP